MDASVSEDILGITGGLKVHAKIAEAEPKGRVPFDVEVIGGRVHGPKEATTGNVFVFPGVDPIRPLTEDNHPGELSHGLVDRSRGGVGVVGAGASEVDNVAITFAMGQLGGSAALSSPRGIGHFAELAFAVDAPRGDPERSRGVSYKGPTLPVTNGAREGDADTEGGGSLFS